MAGLEVRVQNLDCEGCSSKIRRALLKLKGVQEVEIDAELQKITVRGYAVREKKVMKAIRGAGKTAEPWPFPAAHSHLASSFYTYPAAVASSYHREASCTAAAAAVASTAPEVRAFFHTPSVYAVAVASDETVASLFSDENPHACSIM